MRCVRVRIEGRVQGVAYRAWARSEAGGFGISGWVRNRADGSVEAELCGDDAAVERMIARCRVGPPAAAVTAVRIICDGAAGTREGFCVRATE